MKSIKVVHVVHDFLFGGIEAYIFYLAQAQSNNELLEFTILCCQNEDKVLNKRVSNIPGIKIKYVNIRGFDLNIANYYKIYKFISTFDVVHLHVFKPILAFLLGFSSNKLVFTVHGAGNISRPKDLVYRFKNIIFVYFLNNFVDLIINNSNFTKSYWIKKSVLNKNNIVIYNGVLFENKPNLLLIEKEYPDFKNKFIIGTTSRFISWKRVDLLIKAFSFFVKNKVDVCLLLVGQGPEFDNLKKLTFDLNISDFVIFAGYRNNVTDFQSIMDICVFPSVSEPFGLVAIECLSLGKPTIVLKDGGGISEIINLIQPDDIVIDTFDLARRMEYYYINRFNPNLKLENKRVSFSDNFNIFKIENQIFDAYNSLF